jgi:hypothetical protein
VFTIFEKLCQKVIYENRTVNLFLPFVRTVFKT